MQRLRKAFLTMSSFLSTLTLSLIPVFKSCPPCPLCMPKYAAILSFLGLPLADYNAYLMPLMWVSMVTSIASLAWQGPRRYGDRLPAYVALLGCIVILLSRELTSTPILYSGMLIFLGSTIWHQWRLRSHRSSGPCCSHHSS